MASLLRIIALNEIFIYMRNELPFVIPDIPSPITLSVFGLIVFATLSFSLDYKDSIKWFKEIPSYFKKKA